MTPEDCAQTLQQSDPDRFAAVMAAQPADRARLATLYAANLEIASAALSSAEPLISQMRLQWWADQIGRIAQGAAPDPHPVLVPLAEAWGADVASLADLVEARRRDAMREPFDLPGDVIAHVDACTGTLMRLGASACGLPADHPVIPLQARGAGLAAWLRAYPRLRSLNLGLQSGAEPALASLAVTGLQALDSARLSARKDRPIPKRAAPALFSGAGATAALRAIAHGETAQLSEFKRKWAYLRLSFQGRWQD